MRGYKKFSEKDMLNKPINITINLQRKEKPNDTYGRKLHLRDPENYFDTKGGHLHAKGPF
jgi:hypothetical protein